MIFILSEEIDKSTDIVCNWLYYSNFQFLRINSEVSSNFHLQIHIKEMFDIFFINNKGESYDFNKFSKAWFRRGFFNFELKIKKNKLNIITIKSIEQHIKNEADTIFSLITYLFCEKYAINNPNNYNQNKLIALYEAQKIGFQIPQTLLCDKTKLITDFVNNNSCIAKNIQDIFPIKIKPNIYCCNYIKKITVNEITENKYWYSLFQKEIEKKYELRVFYFLGQVYTMAIFSQLDKESAVDFRNVNANGEHPNRMVPFILPHDIKIKIKRLMKVLKLESGSLDIIVDYHDDYYFLEVNPVGQFNFVSEICNYYIEKDIAKHLKS